MSTNCAALSRLMQQVEAGTDALVTGSLVETQQLLAEAAERLRADWGVVEVAADAAGLSLSRLMAQLSGRGDLDAQDDAVLELGFRRLAVPEVSGQRTVLLLNAGQGIHRSALRFLQHVGRGAPGLVMVVAAGAELETLLDEPGFAALRGRLTAAPAVSSDAPAQAVEPAMLRLLAAPAEMLAVEPTLMAPTEPAMPALPLQALSAPARSPAAAESRTARGRGRVWAVSGAGMVASLAIGALIGHASAPRLTRVTADAGTSPASAVANASVPARSASDQAVFATKIEPAQVPAPKPAIPARIVLAAPPDPAGASAAAPALAQASVPALASAGSTPATSMQQAAAVPALLAEPVTAEDRAAASNLAGNHDPETLQARAPDLFTLPPDAAEPTPAPKAALAGAPPVFAPPVFAPPAFVPPVFAPEQPARASAPILTDDQPRRGEDAAQQADNHGPLSSGQSRPRHTGAAES